MKCEKVTHTSGKTPVERIRYHFSNKGTKRLKLRLITSVFRPALKPGKVREFKVKFAMWFYSTALVFHKVEHQTLSAAMQLLTPSSVTPTRQQLAGPYLTLVMTRFQLMLKLSEKLSTVATNAWTHINDQAVINYVLLFEDLTVFLETVYTGSTSHDAVFLADDLSRVLVKLRFLTVAAVVTDKHRHKSDGLDEDATRTP
ncbi:LOW QUALITY PROTEIN: Transposase, partial [Phytophthora megakarya]